MYSLKTKKEELKKAKRMKKNVIKKDYVDCLFEERKFMHAVQIIRSFKHQFYTIKQNKVTLIPYNEKRYMMDNGVSFLPYCKYLGNLLIIFFRNFCNIFQFLRILKQK